MRKGSIVAALITFAIGLFLVVQSNKLPAGFSGALGADIFPRWLGVGIMLLSLVQLLSEFVPSLRSPGSIAWPEGRWRNQVVCVGTSTFVYLCSLDILGFSLATLLIVAALVRILGGYRWLPTLGIAVLSAALCTVIFKFWLEVQLPGGLLGI